MSVINTQVQPFKVQAFHNGKFIEVTEQSLKGKWSTLIFMPAAFTFNCPTEVEDAADNYAEFQKLEAEGRILTRDWRKYNSRDDVVYRPKQMSAAELLAGFRYANQRFYSLAGIAKRLSRSATQWWWALPLNLVYAYQWRRAVSRN